MANNAIELKVAEVRTRRLADNEKGLVHCPDCKSPGPHVVENTDFLCRSCDRYFPVVRDRDITPVARPYIGGRGRPSRR